VEQPDLDFGPGHGCNLGGGRFEILEAVYGPDSTLDRFHAKFEQRCDGATAGLTGEVCIPTNPSR